MSTLPHRVADDLDFYTVIDAPGAALVVFTAPACGACRRAKAVVPQLAGAVDRWIEVPAERSPGLVADLEIFHLPALFLYVDGGFHAPIDAVLTPAALSAAIETARMAPAVEPP